MKNFIIYLVIISFLFKKSLEIIKNSIIYLVIISFSFQSCYTYRTIDLKETPLIAGKNYKIKQDTKFTKAKLNTTNDSIITFMVNNHEVNVPVSKIKEIKAREFSTLKTAGLVLSLGLVAIVIIGAAAMDDFDLGFNFVEPTTPN
jgi:putative cell wall-binding protein